MKKLNIVREKTQKATTAAKATIVLDRIVEEVKESGCNAVIIDKTNFGLHEQM